MNLQFEALWEIHQFLTSSKIPYAVIGGIAVQYWGEPRLTRDVDATVLVSMGQEKALANLLLEKFKARLPEALEFALKNRVLLLEASNGCPIDLSFGLPGYEEQVIARAIDYDLGESRLVQLCRAEDLIIHKAVAGRPQDCSDIEGVIFRQGRLLDVAYIRKWLKELGNVLGSSEVLQRFQSPWRAFSQERGKT